MPTGAQAAASPVRPHRLHPSASIIIVMLLAVNALGAELEDESLLRFKSSLANTDPALRDWVPSKPPCSGSQGNWFGVLCFDGYVWGLQLESLNLKGQIDVNALVPLRFLRTLSFMNNEFEGVMPDWRKLGALKSLYVSNNQFSGQIPEDAFKGMTSLKKVHMANNKFSGHIPSSLESPKLIELRLENNQFTGTIPAISSDNLKNLNVSNNQLEGPIPPLLSKLDPTSFLGNKGLCGKPSETECDPPLDQEPSLGPATNEKSRITIIILSILVALFLIALLILLYSRRRGSQMPQLGREQSPEVIYAEKSLLTGTTAAAASTLVETKTTKGKQGSGGGQAQAGKLSFVRDDRQKFDLQDLMRASAEVLGSGNFGASYKAVLVDGDALVVKRFKLMNNVAKEDFHEHMRRLGRLKHPNLLPLVAYLYRKEEKLLVFDFVQNGSLASHLHGKHSPEQSGLSWASRLRIIKGVAKGIAYLHGELPTLNVPHGHLKSSNVLLDNNFNPLLMDYSLVPVVNPTQVHQILVAYKSPDYAQNGHACKKTDVWCLGILILETLTGKFVTKSLVQGGEELAGWINAIVEEAESSNNIQVFDKDMDISTESCRVEMEKLLKIGIACCQEDPDKRWDLEEAIKIIEQIQDEIY